MHGRDRPLGNAQGDGRFPVRPGTGFASCAWAEAAVLGGDLFHSIIVR
jgi:hypothetical protein